MPRRWPRVGDVATYVNRKTPVEWQGRKGRVILRARGRGPKNCLVDFDGIRVVCPVGHLVVREVRG